MLTYLEDKCIVFTIIFINCMVS